MSQPVLTGRATASSGRWVHSREPRNLNITEPFPDILVSRQKSAIRASLLSRRAHLRWLSHAQRKVVFFPVMSKGVMGDPVTLQCYHLRQGKVSPRGMLLRTAGITSALEIICYSHLTGWVLALSLFHVFLCTQAVKQTILRWCVIHLLMLCTATRGVKHFNHFPASLVAQQSLVQLLQILREICNFFLIFLHHQHIRIFRHQQPEPAEPVGLEPAQPDDSEWAPLLSPEPQTVHVRNSQDVGKNGQHGEARGGGLPEQWWKSQLWVFFPSRLRPKGWHIWQKKKKWMTFYWGSFCSNR